MKTACKVRFMTKPNTENRADTTNVGATAVADHNHHDHHDHEGHEAHHEEHQHSHDAHDHHDHEHDHSHHDHDHDHHGHDHNHSHVPSSLRALLGVLFFTAVIFFAELFGGWYSGSLALISDAMHMLSDSTGLVVAAVAILLARRTATKTATYGYKRFEVVAALLNAVSVSIISVWIVFEAIERFRNGETIDIIVMLVVGVIGLIANIFGAIVLHGHSHENMNVRGAYLHVLVDLFGSVAVIVAALLMQFTGILWADTVASLIIAALILPRSVKLAWESLRVLLEQVPVGVDTEGIVEKLETVEGVSAVHDLHVWSLDGNKLLATCHVVMVDEKPRADCGVLDDVQQAFKELGIDHTTVQIDGTKHHNHEIICHT